MENLFNDEKKQDSQKDASLKRSIEQETKASNEPFLAYYDISNKTIGLYSSTYPSLRDKSYSSFDTDHWLAKDKLDISNARLTKLPNTNFLLAMTFHFSSLTTILQLIEFRSRSPMRDIGSMNLELRQTMTTIDHYEICPPAVHPGRSLIAAFTEEGDYFYKLWRFDNGYIKYLRETRWEIQPDMVTYDFPHSEKSEGSVYSGYVIAWDFNQHGDRIAIFTNESTLQIMDVDTNATYVCALYDDPVMEGFYSPYHICNWMESSSLGTAKVVCNRRGVETLDFYETTKQKWVTQLELESCVACFSVNPFNSNIFAAGVESGKLWQFDQREAFNKYDYKAKDLMVSAKESQFYWYRDRKVEWHPSDPNQLLYQRGSEVYIMDVRKPSSIRLHLCDSLADVCFF